MSPRHVRFYCLAFLAALSAACGGDDPMGPELDQPLVQVATGLRHSCGLTATGAAYCWGWNRDGQLGDGSVRDRTTPVAVGGGLAFTSITAGAGHTCAVTADGTAYCWGFNLSGQLGIGTFNTAPHTGPEQVAGDTRFAVLDAGGGSYTCGLTAEGAAHCWGWNLFGQLGDGSTRDSNTPVAVSTADTLLSLDAGAFHTCGVTTAQAVLCWGDNRFGRLGIGTAIDSVFPTPQTVVSGVSFTSVAVGFEHSCGLDVLGDAYCWGGNAVGQSGTPGTNDNLMPTAVLPSGVSFSTLTVGASLWRPRARPTAKAAVSPLQTMARRARSSQGSAACSQYRPTGGIAKYGTAKARMPIAARLSSTPVRARSVVHAAATATRLQAASSHQAGTSRAPPRSSRKPAAEAAGINTRRLSSGAEGATDRAIGKSSTAARKKTPKNTANARSPGA